MKYRSPSGTFVRVIASVVNLWMLMAGVAYYILARSLIAYHGKDSDLAIAIGKDAKGIVSVVFYAVAIALSFLNSWISCAIYVLVAIMWLVPDRRIEKVFAQ